MSCVRWSQQITAATRQAGIGAAQVRAAAYQLASPLRWRANSSGRSVALGMIAVWTVTPMHAPSATGTPPAREARAGQPRYALDGYTHTHLRGLVALPQPPAEGFSSPEAAQHWAQNQDQLIWQHLCSPAGRQRSAARAHGAKERGQGGGS